MIAAIRQLESAIRASRFELGPYRRALRPEIRGLLGKVIFPDATEPAAAVGGVADVRGLRERERRGYRFTELIRRAPVHRRRHN